MKEAPKQQLRGDAAWRASLKAVGERNDAARVAAGRRRAVLDKNAADFRAAALRRERPAAPGH